MIYQVMDKQMMQEYQFYYATYLQQHKEEITPAPRRPDQSTWLKERLA